MELTLRDLVEKSSIDLSRVRLIRHALSNPDCKKSYDHGYFDLYNSHQKIKFSEVGDYWIVFKSGLGTTAILYNVYRVTGKTPDNEYTFEEGCTEHAIEGCAIYSLEPVEEFSEYIDRLIIDWGKDTINWHKDTLNPKIVAITPTKNFLTQSFNGYDDFVLSFDELSEIIYNQTDDWYKALSSVNAVYIITDITNGKQYIGSSWNIKDGLWDRWKFYVDTHDGGNIEFKNILDANPEQYRNFRFAILQVLPKNVSKDTAEEIENRWKKKLFSREFGNNKN
ncbi:MAG: GIY-YIG nuclease family protein [Oscillospiraceae bacterium]|nr:GIY-YIG nuclease family protein [Oscillospiraceae bacterium]